MDLIIDSLLYDMSKENCAFRSCFRCNREIILCNGFTLARDLVSGRIPIREHCGLCVTWLEVTGTAETYLRELE